MNLNVLFVKKSLWTEKCRVNCTPTCEKTTTCMDCALEHTLRDNGQSNPSTIDFTGIGFVRRCYVCKISTPYTRTDGAKLLCEKENYFMTRTMKIKKQALQIEQSRQS